MTPISRVPVREHSRIRHGKHERVRFHWRKPRNWRGLMKSVSEETTIT